VDIDTEARTATVEPGLVLSKLNAATAKHGLMFGPDPASAERATMGGVIGNNATGAHSILYGMTADHLVSADVIQADGSLATWGHIEPSAVSEQSSAIASTAMRIREKYADAIRRDYPQSWRNSAGYRLNYLLSWSASTPPQWSDDWSLVDGYYPPVSSDSINLASLLAGSEGTLAVIRRATVNLVPKPAHTILGVLAYDSVAEACDDVPRLLEFNPSAVELVPQMLIRLAKDVPAYASQVSWVNGDPAALLVVEFSGSGPEVLKEALRQLGPDVVVAESEEDQAHVWAVRKVGLGIFDSRPADARPVAFIEDCAIPVERLGEFVREVEKILAAQGTQAAFYAHASAGCLHIRPILNLKLGEGRRALRTIAEATLALTLRLGGSMSSEHGDGMLRGEFLHQIYGTEVVEAMRLLKQAADPENLLNPGKLLDAPPMDTHLRYGEEYSPSPWPATLDFSRNHGLAGAIEQCNGQGVCRKDGGVMCPSFQATRNEQNSTRGRANLLRALISTGVQTLPDGPSAMEKAVYEALDLCLACKGCKAECPSGVDMAKLKYEFQHEYYKSHPRRLRDYVFAYIGSLARLGAPFGKIVNWLEDTALEKVFLDRFLGITEKRLLPRFGSPDKALYSIDAKPVETCLFLPDTFSHFFEPEIEQATLQVLAACGVEVKTLPLYGAGRTFLSKGFIEQAQKHAKRLLDAIRRLDPHGTLPIVGLEPSELYTLRDEFQDLLPARAAEEVRSLASRSWLIDEFLIREGLDHKKRYLRITNTLNRNNEFNKQKIALHGHCYQKTQPPASDGFAVGQNASAELLRAFGYEVEIIPSGCCGMAGAFGYEAEHFGVSMQIGELALLPAVRRAKQSGNAVSAMGTSCRSQIADGAGVQAQHPVVLVGSRLKHDYQDRS
jgi:FAD/FMN-containing dehydrogenase/Fe-S oxidoreductase